MSDRSFAPALILLLLPGVCLAQQTEIHRCLQEDGTVAFQETPCAEAADEAAADDDDGEGRDPAPAEDVFVNPFDEPAPARPPSEPALPAALSEDRAACEKTTRDAIDAIDLEMRKGYTKEQGQQYLAELLGLTQQLRACKQL